MRSDASLKNRIIDIHLSKPYLELKEIALMFKCSYTYVCQSLEQKNEYLVVSGLNNENEYFLFTSLVEKTIKTDYENKVINAYDFNTREKVFLKGYGFKF